MHAMFHYVRMYLFTDYLWLTETLMDSKWATTELAWTTYPESGVSTSVPSVRSHPLYLHAPVCRQKRKRAARMK